MAVCDPGLEPVNGNIVVVSVDGGVPIMRRWYRGGNTVMLVAESHERYDDIVLAGGDSYRVLGVVVWIQLAEPLAWFPIRFDDGTGVALIYLLPSQRAHHGRVQLRPSRSEFPPPWPILGSCNLAVC